MMDRLDRLGLLFENFEAAYSPCGQIRELLHSYPGLALIADLTGVIRVASAGWEDALGFTPRELEGCCWDCRLVEKEVAAEQMRGVLEDSVTEYVNQWFCRDQKPVTLRWTSSPWMDVGDGVPLVFSTAEVVSDS